MALPAAGLSVASPRFAIPARPAYAAGFTLQSLTRPACYGFPSVRPDSCVGMFMDGWRTEIPRKHFNLWLFK